LEDYLIAPFAVYEQRGQAVSAKLPEWGRALFEGVFGAGKPGRDAYLKSREGACELVLRSHSPAFLGLPWELLQDPQRATPLALELSAIDRTLIAAGAAAAVPPGEALRVLMVIARPAGLQDIGYQMIARPLLERLSAVRGQVELEVLRPPTLEALTGQLKAAVANRPYHILHFDGHGTFGVGGAGGGGQHQFDGGTAARGYLAFEAEGGGEDLVPAEEFALAVNQARVPLVVLNACRSGMMGDVAVEAAVATRLLEGGAASAVAMGYSVYAVAAAEFMTAFYQALFARKTVSEAVSEGRRRLYRRRERPSPKGMLPLEDWIMPVHHLRSTINFTDLKRPEAAGTLSLDALLDRMRPSGSAATSAAPASDPLAPVGRFVGRDAAFYTLELALKWQRVVVVHGPAGTDKTELAKAFGRWWQATGGVENPAWVFFHSFEPGVASFGLDGVITAIGLQLFGADFIGRTRDAAERSGLILQLLRERRMLLIWDNFESVRELPDPTGATPPLDAVEQQCMRAFLAAVAQDGQSGVIVTSRTPETWLGDVRRVELGGLTPSEAAEMAEDVLRPYPAARTKRQERAFAELMVWLEGHPLSLRLLLPQLERVSAGALLAALHGKTAELPAGFVGEDRQGTPPDLASDAGALWLFAVGSEATRAILAGELDRAYGIYNTIRQTLEASPGPEQRQRLGVVYHQLGAVEQDRGDLAAAEEWYRKSLEIKEALKDRPSMVSSYHQLGAVALRRGDLGAAEEWSRKSLEIEEALGDRPGMANSYGQLGNITQQRGDLDAAEEWYRKSLGISEALGDRPRLARTYHNLGVAAARRGDLAAAEEWYRKSLGIQEALGYRPGLAKIYDQLGLLADARGEPSTALDWMVRCVALFREFPHPATGPGSRNLDRMAASLGMPALEASWPRCTGASLPAQIRATVLDMINKAETA
jgi:tetratricopeptide (TPR) repeat protein